MSEIEDQPEHRAIADALQAYVSKASPGEYVVGWVVAVCAAKPLTDAQHEYYFLTNDAPIHHTVGLVEVGREHFYDCLKAGREDSNDD